MYFRGPFPANDVDPLAICTAAVTGVWLLATLGFVGTNSASYALLTAASLALFVLACLPGRR